jgi:hypothetical protein
MRVVEYPNSKVEIAQAEEGFEPAKWWQLIDKDGTLLAETGVRSDFAPGGMLDEDLAKDGVTIRRLYERVERRWVEEEPFPKEEDLA